MNEDGHKIYLMEMRQLKTSTFPKKSRILSSLKQSLKEERRSRDCSA